MRLLFLCLEYLADKAILVLLTEPERKTCLVLGYRHKEKLALQWASTRTS